MPTAYDRLRSETINSLPEGITSRDAAYLWMMGFRDRWVSK